MADKWHDKVGLFIPVPDELASQYPSSTDGNGGKPHVTFLIIGKVDENHRSALVNVVRDVFSRFDGEVCARFQGLDYFRQPENNKSVAYVQVEFNRDLGRLRDILYGELQDAGFEVEDRNPGVYFPHSTLVYLKGIDAEFTGAVPSGSWCFNEMEIWNLQRDPLPISFGNYGVAVRLAIDYREFLRLATKEQAVKEEEEAQKRTLRRRPKKKPPRKDLRRQRIQETDADVGGKDPDMSMRERKAQRETQSFVYREPHIGEGYGSLHSLSSRRRTQDGRLNREGDNDMSKPVSAAREQITSVASLIKHSHRELGIQQEDALRIATTLEQLSKRAKESSRIRMAQKLSAALDYLADFVQGHHDEWGIPAKIAMDAAHKFDLLSDHLEKEAGIQSFSAETIGETKSGPLKVLNQDDDLPGEFTQEEFHSVRDVAEQKTASHGYNLFL